MNYEPSTMNFSQKEKAHIAVCLSVPSKVKKLDFLEPGVTHFGTVDQFDCIPTWY